MRKSVLRKYGEIMGRNVSMASVELAEHISPEMNGEMELEDIQAILLFINALYYSVVFRTIFEILSDKEMDQFLAPMVDSIIKPFLKQWEDPSRVEPLIREAFKNCVQLLKPYMLKLSPDNAADPRGTLYWEFLLILKSKYDVELKNLDTINISASNIGVDLSNKTITLLKS